MLHTLRWDATHFLVSDSPLLSLSHTFFGRLLAKLVWGCSDGKKTEKRHETNEQCRTAAGGVSGQCRNGHIAEQKGHVAMQKGHIR